MKIIFKSLSIHLIDKFLQWWAKAEQQINQPFQLKPREINGNANFTLNSANKAVVVGTLKKTDLQ